MNGWLKSPDERVAKAFARLRGDPDFMQVLAWLEHSLGELDRAKRSTMDGAALRMQQGASKAVAEFIGHANGNKATAISPRDTSHWRPQGERTP